MVKIDLPRWLVARVTRALQCGTVYCAVYSTVVLLCGDFYGLECTAGWVYCTVYSSAVVQYTGLVYCTVYRSSVVQ